MLRSDPMYRDDTMGFTILGYGYADDPMIDIGVIDGGTVYGGGNSGGSGIDWQSVINQGFGAASQIFGAWGPRPTQQTGPGGVPIGGGYSPAAYNQSQAQLQQAIAQQQQAALNAQGGVRPGTNTGLGTSVGGGVDGIIQWATANPIPVFLGIAGVFLLFREPPRGRR
jgi:hypothetical protein